MKQFTAKWHWSLWLLILKFIFLLVYYFNEDKFTILWLFSLLLEKLCDAFVIGFQTLMDRRIRPWVNKKIVEYIGEEEPTLSDFICQKVMGHCLPHTILSDIAMVCFLYPNLNWKFSGRYLIGQCISVAVICQLQLTLIFWDWKFGIWKRCF